MSVLALKMSALKRACAALHIELKKYQQHSLGDRLKEKTQIYPDIDSLFLCLFYMLFQGTSFALHLLELAKYHFRVNCAD
jgi:hypothetical protein